MIDKELTEKDDKEEWVKLSSSVAVNVTCEQTGDGHAAPLREAEDIANLAKKYGRVWNPSCSSATVMMKS